MAEAVVRVARLDGSWQTLGVDETPGVVPDSLTCSATATSKDKPGGSEACQFTLRREPKDLHPDLLSWTPCEIEIDGRLVWSGRIRDPIGGEGEEPLVTVVGEGWKYHADDEQIDRFYVQSRLEDWRDQRSFPSADLARFTQNGQVQTGEGVITLGQGEQTDWNGDTGQAVTLDLGPANRAKRVVVDFEQINLNGNGVFDVFVRGTDDVKAHPASAGYEDAVTLLNGAVGSTTYAATFATPHRYVHIFLYWEGAGGSTGSDHLLIVKHALVFRETAYESGNASILKASDVVKDQLQFCPLLDQSQALITATAENIGDFA